MPKMSEWQNYGGLTVFNNSASEPVVDGVARVITAWANAMATSAQVTSDPVINNHVVITDGGDYKINFNMSLVGSNNRTFEIAVNINGSPSFSSDLTVSNNEPRNIGAHSIVSLLAGTAITVTQQAMNGGTSLTVVDAEVSLERLV